MGEKAEGNSSDKHWTGGHQILKWHKGTFLKGKKHYMSLVLICKDIQACLCDEKLKKYGGTVLVLDVLFALMFKNDIQSYWLNHTSPQKFCWTFFCAKLRWCTSPIPVVLWCNVWTLFDCCAFHKDWQCIKNIICISYSLLMIYFKMCLFA